jgi:hypothetical protein
VNQNVRFVPFVPSVNREDREKPVPITAKPSEEQIGKVKVALSLPTAELPPGENPSLATKIVRLKKELKVWVKAGMKLVPKEVRQARLAECEKCQYYNARGNMGLGVCQVPGCGCSRVKLALATSKCPHPAGAKWPEWNPSA